VWMLRRITKCATHVTLNRTTAPFVRLCDVHIRPIRPGPRFGTLRRVGVCMPRRGFEVRGRLTRARRAQAHDRAPPLRYVPNLRRSGDARGTLSRRALSKRGIASTRHLRRAGRRGPIGPCRRPCESMFPVVRAERASAARSFARSFGMQFAAIRSGAELSISFRRRAAQAVDAGGLAKHNIQN
jgi:hypothetical protein